MTKRPISITVLCWLCIVFGVCGFLVNFDWLTTRVTLLLSAPLGMIIHMREPAWLTRLYPFVWYSDLHPLAMWLFPAQWLFLAMCGVFMLRGFNWARWMLVAWVGYHTFQSIAHTWFELLFNALYYVHSPWEALAHMHVYIAILCIVFTPSAHRYFRAVRAAG
jgi:hypothetical protein